jgi:hypothetical protein
LTVRAVKPFDLGVLVGLGRLDVVESLMPWRCAQPWLTSVPVCNGIGPQSGTRFFVRFGMFSPSWQYTRQTRLWFQRRPFKRSRS